VHGKPDANQHEIVDALQDVGAFVQSLADVGNGVPDLLVGFRGMWFVLEVKSAGGKLTSAQVGWHRVLGERAKAHIVRTVDDALCAIGAKFG
jgi:hypothetical protein